MPYIFEHDNYHLILVLYIFLVENAKLKNEVYKNLVKLVQNFLVIYYKHILISRIHEKKYSQLTTASLVKIIPKLMVCRDVFRTLSKIYDGVFCENS